MFGGDIINEKEIIKGLLAEFFKYNKYEVAIIELKKVLFEEDNYYRKNWSKIKDVIINKKFQSDEPLELIQISANLVLDEKSDEEAYNWLDLMIKNVERFDNIIKEY